MKQNLSDPVIDEIREVRHRISARFDHDPTQMVAFYMEMQKQYQDRLIETHRALCCAATNRSPNPTSPTQRELCRFSLFSTTQVIELLNPCTPNSPQYRL